VNEALSVYIHIPFCTRKCPYCHFFVLLDDPKKHQLLLEALLLDWERWRPHVQGMKIVSVYFGGGTPSLMPPNMLEELLCRIAPSTEAEITIEANPESTSLALMRAFRSIGVNRVSLGVQSLEDSLLGLLGRTHTARQALLAIKEIEHAGFDNLSIDLMYEVPGQTVNHWIATLQAISTLPISHLSLYGLTIEPGTPFDRRKDELQKQLPNPQEALSMLKIALQELERMGMERYEISAFAKKKQYSKHNLGYWTGRPFIGIGPSAYSYFFGKRMHTHAHFSRYVRSLQQGISPIQFEEHLLYPHCWNELFVIHLRILSGVNLTNFQRNHGPIPQETQHNLLEIQKKEWVYINQDIVALTEQGRLFYDEVASYLI